MVEPRISIVIPAYNASNFLDAAIESALGQKYVNKEVIVVNDGSKDNGATEACALKFGDRIRYFRKDNGGVSSALNVGLKNMSGEFFAWLSHDDLFLPGKLNMLGDAIEKARLSSDVYTRLFVIHDFQYVDADLRRLKTVTRLRRVYDQLPHVLLTGCHINGCSSLIHRNLFEMSGLFDESLRYSQDLDMWLRLGKHAHFLHVPEVLASVRLHPQQVTVRKAVELGADDTTTFIRHLDELSASPGEVQRASVNLFQKNLRASTFWGRLGSFYQSVRDKRTIAEFCYRKAINSSSGKAGCWLVEKEISMRRRVPSFLQKEFLSYYLSRAREFIEDGQFLRGLAFRVYVSQYGRRVRRKSKTSQPSGTR